MEDLYRSQFRIPYGLYEKLKTSAEKSSRSLNAELIARLERSFAPPDEQGSSALKEIAAKMNESAVSLLNAASRVVASSDEMNSMLEVMVHRSEESLRAAVEAIEANDTSPGTLEKLKRELAGLQYFIEGLHASRKDDKP